MEGRKGEWWEARCSGIEAWSASKGEGEVVGIHRLLLEVHFLEGCSFQVVVGD